MSQASDAVEVREVAFRERRRCQPNEMQADPTAPIEPPIYRPTRTRQPDSAREVSEAEILEAVIASVYELADDGSVDIGISFVFRQLDSWLRNSRFDLVDRFLIELDPYVLQTELALAPLAITLGAKPSLDPEIRESYVDRARQQLYELHEPAYADELILRFE